MSQTPVRTSDGSFTLYSPVYQEHYHGVRDGALAESLYKHVIPGVTYSGALGRPAIRILDICFGLGFNTLATLYYLKQQDYRGSIEIVSPEMDTGLVRSLAHLQYPAGLFGHLEVIASVSRTFLYQKERLTVRVVPGDATHFVQEASPPFDIIYQDPFSPKKNPELWTPSFFTHLRQLIAPHGVLTTYSQARSVREALTGAGFEVYDLTPMSENPIRSGTLGAPFCFDALTRLSHKYPQGSDK